MFKSISKTAIIVAVSGTAVIILILAITLGVVLNQCKNAVGPRNLKITKPGPRHIQLSWLNSEEDDDCDVTYMIRYKVNQQREVEVTTARQHYSFTTLDLCFDLVVNVWSISGSGRKSDGHARLTYDSQPIAPNDIPEPLGERFTSTTEGLELTWPKSRELDNCDVHYITRIVTDLKELPETPVDSERITIDENKYCFSVYAYIKTVIGESTSPEFLHHYTGILQPPEDIGVVTSPTEHTLTASWSRHPKQFQCGIEYMIKYSLLNSEETVHRTSDVSIVFPTAYCNTAILIFSTVFGDQESYTHTWIRRENLPESIGPVQNIRFEWTGEKAVLLLWDSPAFAEACTDIVYSVTARNDDVNITNTCYGDQFCEIHLEDFCPVTEFNIQAASIEGEEHIEIYRC